MKFSRPGLQSFVLLSVISFLSLCVWAQTGTTGIQGQVLDRSGAAISGATVTVTNIATGAERKSQTNETGTYIFTSLAPGSYRVRVEAAGFRTAVHDAVQLLVNSPVRLNVNMQVGGAQETVEVSATAERLNTIDASVGNAMGERQIAELPLEARNVVGLLSLQPGAVYVPGNPTDPVNADPRNGSVSGGHADQANLTLDGIDVNDPQNGFAYTAVLRSTPDSVQEFRVTTTNFGADTGRSSGAQVSLITKSGTNTPHGSVYWLHRNTAFSSNEWFNKMNQLQNGWPNRPPKLQKHIFGASFGFAPIKDRLFFFGTFDDQRLAASQSAERRVPSETMRDGILTYPCANPAECPASVVQGFTTTHNIPAGWYGANPTQLAALDPLHIGPSVALSEYFRQFPTGNTTGRDGSVVGGQLVGNIVGYRFAAPVRNNLWTYITRLDYKLDPNGNHQLMWRGNLQNDKLNSQPQYCFNGSCSPPQSVTSGNNKGFMVGYTAAFSSSLVNNLRYGYTRIGSSDSGTLNSDYVDIRFIDDLNPYTNSHGRIIPTHNITDDLSWTTGKHTLGFGTNLRWTRVNTNDNVNSYRYVVTNGSWVSGNGKKYTPGVCSAPACSAIPAVDVDPNSPNNYSASWADSWIDILGVLSESGATYNFNKDGSLIPFGTPIRRNWATNGYELYVQDNWRIKSNFNVVLGLRWGYQTPPWETNGLQTAPNVPISDWFNKRWSNMLSGIPDNTIPLLQFDLAGKANGKNGFYKPDYNDFSPRIAFTYSPGWTDGFLRKLTGGPGKTVIRGGFGRAYDQIGLGIATQFDTAGAFGISSNLESPWHGHSEDDPTVRFTSLTGIPDTIPPAPDGTFPYTPPTQAGAISQSIDNSIRTPYSNMFNFFIGRELPGKMTVDVGYVGRRGRNLLTRRDLAMPLDLVDPTSKMDYFTAARKLIDQLNANGQDWTKVTPIPFWENVFPRLMAGYNASYASDYGPIASNTQAAGFMYSGMGGDWTTALYSMDEFCDPACAGPNGDQGVGSFTFFNQQFDSLWGISSVGRSTYDALQVSLRKAYSAGIQFDANYTYAKSSDTSSAVERGSNYGNWGDYFYTGVLINTWDPKSSFGPSDFDVRHQFNFNYVVDLPFGKGRKFGGNSHGIVDAILGGWQTSGILRLTSRFPFDIINCRSCWPTNWQLQGNTQYTDLNAVRDLLGHNTSPNAVGGNPSPFKDPKAVLNFLQYSYPGEGGQRNRLRGDGYFTLDTGFGKTFKMPYNENHLFRFRWEIFNLTNTARFNVQDAILVPDFATTFGAYQSTMSGCDNAAGRCMQVSLRYEF